MQVCLEIARAVTRGAHPIHPFDPFCPRSLCVESRAIAEGKERWPFICTAKIDHPIPVSLPLSFPHIVLSPGKRAKISNPRHSQPQQSFISPFELSLRVIPPHPIQSCLFRQLPKKLSSSAHLVSSRQHTRPTLHVSLTDFSPAFFLLRYATSYPRGSVQVLDIVHPPL